jgi:hypothetical protein
MKQKAQMKRSDAYPSKFFKAADYDDDWKMTVEIELARMEEIGADGKKTEKLVVYFRRVKQGLVSGPTIFDQIADVTGEDDSDDWKGHRIELFRDTTFFGGKQVPAIRVRAVGEQPKKKMSPKKKPDEKPDMDDEIPH